MNAFIWSESFAGEFWALFVEAALKSTGLLVIAIVALRTMRGCSAATRHLVLALVLASLPILPLLSGVLPRLGVLPAWLTFGAVPSRTADAGESRSSPIQGVEIAAKGPAANHTARERSPTVAVAFGASSESGEQSLRSPGSGLSRWVPIIWATGVLCTLLPAVGGVIRLRRVQGAARVEEGGALPDRMRQLSDRLGLRRRVELFTAPNRSMPMTWGILRPRVLLPCDAREWPEHRQTVVLLHELAHVQRLDCATTLFIRVVCALYWFNPLVWLVARRVRLEQEQACDDTVLSAGNGAADYAEEVLQIVTRPAVEAVETFGALTIGRPSTLETRVRAILDRERNRASPTRLAVLTSALMLALALVPLAMLRAADAASANSPARAAVTSREPAAASTDRGLVAWWRAEEDGKDSVGKHHGEFPFGIRFLPGVRGAAFDFRRSYVIEDLLARVSIPDSPDFQFAGAFTLEAWIHPMGYGGIVLFRGDDRPGYDHWQLDLITPGKISFNFDDRENKSVELLAPIRLNQWQHVVATFEPGAVKLYLNGALAAESPTPLRPVTTLDPAHHPALGIGNTGGKRYTIPFDGLIDEVRLYNRALPAAEVAERAKI